MGLSRVPERWQKGLGQGLFQDIDGIEAGVNVERRDIVKEALRPAEQQRPGRGREWASITPHTCRQHISVIAAVVGLRY